MLVFSRILSFALYLLTLPPRFFLASISDWLLENPILMPQRYHVQTWNPIFLPPNVLLCLLSQWKASSCIQWLGLETRHRFRPLCLPQTSPGLRHLVLSVLPPKYLRILGNFLWTLWHFSPTDPHLSPRILPQSLNWALCPTLLSYSPFPTIPSPLATSNLFSVSMSLFSFCFVCLLLRFFRFHIYVRSYSIFFSLSDLFHLA